MPEVSLLQDTTSEDRMETIRRLKLILQDPVKYLKICKLKKMEFSWVTSKFCLALINMEDNEMVRQFIPQGVIGKVVKHLLHTVNYDDHDKSKETPLEKVLSARMWDLYWDHVFNTNSHRTKEKLVRELLRTLAENGYHFVQHGLRQESQSRRFIVRRTISLGIGYFRSILSPFLAETKSTLIL